MYIMYIIIASMVELVNSVKAVTSVICRTEVHVLPLDGIVSDALTDRSTRKSFQTVLDTT
jgi:hypothetical protein